MSMDDFIRKAAGHAVDRPAEAVDNQALLDRAAVYVEKTGCSLREALDLVKAAGQAEPVKPTAGNAGEGTGGVPNLVDMNRWIRKLAGH